jgi:hypothetical protein
VIPPALAQTQHQRAHIAGHDVRRGLFSFALLSVIFINKEYTIDINICSIESLSQ